jgi:DNA modification methylase
VTPYYQQDGVTIYHGDCRDVLPSLPVVDLVLTDPPYGVLSESGSAATRRSGGNKDDGRMAWDVVPSGAFMESLLRVGSARMIWGGCHMALPPTFGYLIWDKKIDGLNFGEAEYCWTDLKFAPRIFRYRAVGIDGGKVHPTQKPVALMRWCIAFAPHLTGTVLDPFMGSGTTLVAAKRMGRTAIGVELNERYCEIAAERLAQGALCFEESA